ncbi:T-cell surface antigen CD2-like isoform X2 [Melanotaenia boesemani]|uniref:T-cell surface antigen CD2-like isoform X2 n=1 Tax=Melanotaenia boesemani TaxID=1250792 RepID=UPI001C0577C7|nr:T-cell surface antigen CD2-like isoform X2 [Melanotaenia boesemani]
MLTAKWTFLIWALTASTVGSADDPGPYRELGTTVVISAGPVTDKVTSIVWKHGPDIAAEWFGSSVSYYRHFEGRCQLNTANGDLTIKNVTREDSGKYTAEISDLVKDPTEIRIIAPVPTPTITTRCNTEKTYCVLTCEGDVTDAGQVRYSWINGDMEAKPGSKTLNITQEQKEAEFGCSLKNPVSQKSSQKVQNPFIKVSGTANPALFALLLLIPVILIVFVCFVFRKRIKEKLNSGRWCNRNKGGQEEEGQLEEIETMLHNTNTENAQIHSANTSSENPDMNLQNGEAPTPLQTSTGTSETNTGTENPDCNLQSGEAPTPVLTPIVTSDTSTETEIEIMIHNTNTENAQIHSANTSSENPFVNLQNGEAPTPLQTSTGTSETNTGTGAVEQDQVQAENAHIHPANTSSENPGEAHTPVQTLTGTSDTSTGTGTPQDSHTCEEDHEQTTANHDGSSETST